MMATRSAIVRGHAAALLEITLKAEGYAKRNVTTNFIGRNGRKLSGRLLNSIFSGFNVSPGLSLPTGFIGTRGLPYGAIHETGGTITPKKAKYLWVKNYYADKYRRLTPKQWFTMFQKTARDRGDGVNYEFRYNKSGKPWAAGVEEDGEFTPLFYLRDQVTIPARPYIMPAVERAVDDYAPAVTRHIRAELRKRFFS